MSNTRNINLTIWTENGEKNATIFTLTNFCDYHFDNGGGKAQYKLIGMEGETPSAVEYFSGEIIIPSEIVQQWGASDEIIFAYVANSLGLTFIN